MTVFESFLRLLNTKMDIPTLFGAFHIIAFSLCILIAVYLCVFRKNDSFDRVRKFVLGTAIVVIILEICKQINFSFSYENGIAFDYPWYAFPWQFCSTPMYVGLLAGLTKKGKFHDSLCAYLATYAIFAGLSVMIYPGDVFIDTTIINIQTMICHGSMLFIGAYLYGSGHVKLEHRTILKALPVFAVTVFIATIMNEIAHQTGIAEAEGFNMFYISPYCAPHLPVYSNVQAVVPYPWSLAIYIAGFTGAAYIILLIAMGIGKLASKKKVPA